MTSAQLHRFLIHPASLGAGRSLALLLVLAMTGCELTPKLRQPSRVRSPYDTGAGQVVWGVAPLTNESGVGVVDVLAVSDELVRAVEGVQGVRSLPVNRTIAAMRALELDVISSPEEAADLAEALGADAVVVGTITAYDPYDPPTLGLTLALLLRPDAPTIDPDEIDPLRLSRLNTEYLVDDSPPERPTAVASVLLDARDHGVLLDIKEYANGRSDRDSALGWRGYTASMELFTRFATHHAVSELLSSEAARIAALDAEREENSP